MNTTVLRYGPAVLTGALLALSFPATNLFPLAWIALIPLLWRTDGYGPWRCAGHFLLAGFVFYAVLLQWLLSHFYWAGGVAFVGHQLASLYMALYWAVLGVVWAWLRQRLPNAISFVVLALLWPVMEFAQANLFTGFGWGGLAYSQGSDLVLVQWACVGGTSLIAMVLVAVNVLLTHAIMKRHRAASLAVVAALLVVSHVGGMLMLGNPDFESKPYRVGILQSNFSQEMKLDPEFALEMVERAAEKSRYLAKHETLDLIVWPESLLTEPITAPGLLPMLEDLARETDCAYFTGATRVSESSGAWRNASVLIDREGEVVGYYDKIHLAPFGEYMPLAYYLPFLRWILPIEDLEAGEEPIVLPVGNRALGPLICFEVLFPAMAEHLRSEGADFLAVITNLGWFGQSNALPQELELARLRAIETRLPLVHSANTGISGVFDPWGRFTAINAVIDRYGNYRELPPDFPPEGMIMERGAGIFALPAPAERPWPVSPRWLPWTLMLASAGLIAWGSMRKRQV